MERLEPKLFEWSSFNYLMRMERQDLEPSEKAIVDNYGKRLMKREILEALTCPVLIGIANTVINYIN